MAQVLPSTGQYIGGALGQITEAIGNALNPNKRFQDSVLAAISKDPTLIQRFADFEASSPGILKNLGIPALGGVAPTPEAEYEAANRQSIIQGKKLALGADMERNKMTTERLKMAFDLMKNRPDISYDVALQTATGETGAQRTISQEQAKQALIQTDVLKAKAPAEIAGANLQTKGFEMAQQMLNEDPAITLERFNAGEFNNGQLMAIFSTPFKDVLLMQQRAYLEKLQRDAMMSNDSDAWQRLREAQAMQLFMETGGVGSKDAAYAYLHQGGAGIAEDLAAKDETTLTPMQRQLVAIHKTLQAARQVEQSKVRQQMLLKLNTATGEFRRMMTSSDKTDGQLELQAQIINGILAESNAPFTASYAPAPAKGLAKAIGRKEGFNKDLVFKDSKGNFVDIGSVSSWMMGVPSAANITPAEVPEKYKAAVEAYKATPDSLKQAAVAKLRGSWKGTPEDLKELEGYLGVTKK